MRDSNVRNETIKKLDNIQFGCGIPKNNWDAMFERLLLYKKEHGDTRVPKRYIDDCGYKLGCWVYNQRRDLPRTKDYFLCDERIERLNRIHRTMRSIKMFLTIFPGKSSRSATKIW